jgi:NAD(P)-dependent dehydrogenase (short-subunit alcohol dehydrogenase family)
LLRSEPGKLHPLRCDIREESGVKEAFKWVKSNLGAVDILVNNAGVCDFNNLTGTFSRTNAAIYCHTFIEDFLSLFIMAQHEFKVAFISSDITPFLTRVT